MLCIFLFSSFTLFFFSGNASSRSFILLRSDRSSLSFFAVYFCLILFSFWCAIDAATAASAYAAWAGGAFFFVSLKVFQQCSILYPMYTYFFCFFAGLLLVFLVALLLVLLFFLRISSNIFNTFLSFSTTYNVVL